MDRSQVREIVNESVRPLRMALGLHRWRIDIEYEALDGRSVARCQPDPLYGRATITFDPAKMESERGVLDALLHELLHVVHAEFETYRRQVAEVVGEKEFNALDCGFSRACEAIVNNIEYMFDICLGLTPKKLVRRGERILDEM